jgi:tetratricopeptide (TPR) repeat protein
MKKILSAIFMVLGAGGIGAQEVPAPKAALLSGLAPVHHSITTSNAESQKFFEQGLSLVYAFNHDEAVRSFERAAELDPKAAMPWWGIALAKGPNINLDVDPEHEKSAYEAEQKALALSLSASENEKAYIGALSKRYSIDPKADLKKLAVDYSNAMREVSGRFPDDLDAATLFAESAMDLRPWRFWKADGTPEEGVEEIVSTLEAVLRRDPNHVGANHYYIHAVEASPHPEKAMASASVLPKLAPGAGHLVHMPAHVYIRTGNYAAAEEANAQAAAVDRAYIQATHAGGIYPLMYYNHNLQFLAAAAMMAGRRGESAKAAAEMVSNVEEVARQDAMVAAMAQFILPLHSFVLLRFHRYGEALKAPEPDKSLKLARAFWHYTRAVAFAGKKNLKRARTEKASFAAAAKEVPADQLWGNNTAADVLALASDVLEARLEEAGGHRAQAIASWRRAVEKQDAFSYDEPPAWYYPVRESLGAALLRAGKADEAEKVFRADLLRNPNSGWSLFGLAESLRSQKKTSDLEKTRKEFQAAWKRADAPLKLEDL